MRLFDPAEAVIEGSGSRARAKSLIEDIYSPWMRGFESRIEPRSRDFLAGLVRSLSREGYALTEKQLLWLEKLYADLDVARMKAQPVGGGRK